MKKCNFGSPKQQCDVHERGSSSFQMHDPQLIFKEFGLEKGSVIVDLGCGPGDYALESARIVGESGMVYALDKQSELLDALKERATQASLANIRTVACEITGSLPVPDHCADVCIAITVLHVPAVSARRGQVFAQVKRVLKPGGRLITIDVKSEDASFGRPVHMRISPEDMEKDAVRHGFERIKLTDLGFTYMMQFAAPASSQP